MLRKYYDTVENNNDANNSSQGGGAFWLNLNRSQKISTIFLAFFSVFLFIFWASDFHRKLRAPFIVYSGTDEVIEDVENIVDQSSIDTDSDGLSDWDEINIYKTSIYLSDTDSDGVSDKEEIFQGNDPLCTGDTCSVSGLQDPESEIDTVTTANVLEDNNFKEDIEVSEISDEDLSDLLTGGSNVEDIKKMLLQSGFDSRMMEQLSDADILASYEQLIKQMEVAEGL